MQSKSLFDHTSEISISVLMNNDKTIIDASNKSFKLFCKWGFDGASSQSIYKQPFNETDLYEASKAEDTLMSTCLVHERVYNESIESCLRIRIKYRT